nr:hypothetical protein BaRGS_027270 [Batillaria attramentaria]
MMIEGDVSLEGQGTPKQTDVPIMTHRGPVATSNMTLDQWLHTVLDSGKGIKLDFKSTEAILPALKILQKQKARLNRPVWLNADVVRGPNAIHDPINASTFLRTVNAILPEVTLSLGWTSGWEYGQDNEAYSWDMVEKMEKMARRLRQPVTFAVRAVYMNEREREKKKKILKEYS